MGDPTTLYYLPIICVLWMFLTLVVTYTIAVCLDHVYPILPYISDTGALLPESCIFGLMLNFGSLLMGCVTLVRFKYLQLVLTGQSNLYKTLNTVNNICVLIGMLSVFGAFIVANFQVTNSTQMHLIGANLCFGCSLFYFFIQTLLCYVINKGTTFRIVLRSILSVLYGVAYMTSLIYAKKAVAVRYVNFTEGLKWDSNHPGYDFRLVSTFSEWILGICHLMYLLSFSTEFKTMDFTTSFTILPEEQSI